ncbi:MAG: hypothetical protein LBR55_05320 [Bacteroidales bacterium]|jgi:hypothetical protein|nr:hypothetical protein [Bacteroidales bacterium]
MTNNKSTAKNALNVCEQLHSYIQNFVENAEISSIELDIALAKTRNLYDVLRLLQLSNSVKHNCEKTLEMPSESQQAEQNTDTITELVETAELVQNEVTEEIDTMSIAETNQPEEESNSADDFAFEYDEEERIALEEILPPLSEQPAQEPMPTPQVVAEPQAPEEEKVVVESPKEEPHRAEPTPEPALQEISCTLSAESKKALADIKTLLQSKQHKDLSSRLGKKPISAISAAIAIHERFRYIKELFNNDIALYNESLQKLNSCADLDEALCYIATHFSWDYDNELTQSFILLVERRYLQ